MAASTPANPNGDPMAPESSPGTAGAVGVRRVNKVPLMIGGVVLLAFVAVVSIVANNQSSLQKPAGDKKETARAAASLADDIIGDNKSRSGTIAPPAASAPSVMVARADAPPTPPGGAASSTASTSAPAAENPDDQRIRMAKLALFDQAVKAKTTVSAAAPRSSGGSAYAPGKPAPMGAIDVAQRLAQVRAQIASAQESDPTAAYQQRLEQIKAAGLAGPGTSAAGASSLTPMSPQAPTGGKNGLGQFVNTNGGDRWKLDSQAEAPRSPYELRAGYVIPAMLISGINSELPGQIVGQVSANVFDTPTGKHLLIPQGSRLVGAYSSDVAYGQSRVLVAWQRIVFPDGKALDLGSMPGSDSAGYSGLNDQVNNHYLRIFGSALMMSGVVAGVAYSQQQGQPQSTNGPPTMQQTLSTALGQQIGQVVAQMVSKNLSIAPTLEIRPGYRFNVVVVKDITFSKPYASFDY